MAVAVALLAFPIAGLALRVPAPAVASPAAAGSATGHASLPMPLTPLAARGGGFRSRPRINPNRPLSRNRPVTRRNPNTGRALRNFSRTLLRALGIAFLLSLLFGIGPGGSPLGLLLLFAIIALVIASRRRRRQYGYR
jgi:hypothetical protein